MVLSFVRRNFHRRFDAGDRMEIFFVAAVTSVLVIRLFLELTGYPQIGGGGLHIAHLLWGGLLMLCALGMLLCLIGQTNERFAALLGGAGFGAFVDEIGKFITSDNDYFFQPAVALIYLFFVALFFVVRAVQEAQNYTREEYLLNALRLVEEVVVRDLDAEERRRARSYLRRSESDGDLFAALEKVLEGVTPTALTRAPLLERVKDFVARVYRRAARLWWFPFAVIAFFLGQLGVKLLYAFILVFVIGLGWKEIFDFSLINRIVARLQNLSFVDWIEIGFSLLSGAFVLWGIVRVRRSRVVAYEWFVRSVLIAILVTQVFAFYKEQFSALVGLLLNVGLLIALRFGIEQERIAEKSKVNSVVGESGGMVSTACGSGRVSGDEEPARYRRRY